MITYIVSSQQIYQLNDFQGLRFPLIRESHHRRLISTVTAGDVIKCLGDIDLLKEDCVVKMYITS